jgi:hypothetical protein
MGWYGNWGGGLHTSKDLSQAKLRDLPAAKDAADAFKSMLNTDLWQFVGEINKVFSPPKSAGLEFDFAKGMRDQFVRIVDPHSMPKKITSLAMRNEKSKSPLVPDDPGPNVVNGKIRKIAAANGLGISFRQEGLGLSLHVAYNHSKCDVHVDRNGFVIRRADGSVHWDLNGVLRHLTVDLIPDKAPWLLGSFGYRDKNDRSVLQGTVAPWLAVDLPSRQNEGKTEVKVGVMVQGRFRGL